MTKICIVVNSCAAFYKTTIPILIKSAAIAQIPMEHMYVIVGESGPMQEQAIIADAYGPRIIHCSYVNIDYNAAVYLTQTTEGINILNSYTHMFYTHDTVEFLEGFWETINTKALHCTSYTKSLPMYTQNIGLINVQWFLSTKKDMFSDFKNTDVSLKYKYKASEFPNESEIRGKYKGLPPKYLGEDAMFWFDEEGNPIGEYFQEFADDEQIIEKYSKEKRNAVLYKSLRLIKYGITGISGYSFML